MNNILHVIKTLATGYFYQSFHQSQKAVLELQRLDDQQYDTPSVLYLLGKAYYDVSNYKDVSWQTSSSNSQETDNRYSGRCIFPEGNTRCTLVLQRRALVFDVPLVSGERTRAQSTGIHDEREPLTSLRGVHCSW